LNEIPINASVFDFFTDKICRLAFDQAAKINTIDIYSKYLEYYKTAPATYRQKVTFIRDSLAYKLAKEANTIESYQLFVDKYTKSALFQMAKDKRDSLAFIKALAANNLVVYTDFISNYPQAKQIKYVLSKASELAYSAAKKNKYFRVIS
jgi:hypothetical protein